MKKKKQFRAPAAAAAAPNMFEAIWSRRKFDVLGKKQKGEGKRLGQLRSRAIDKRKKTILKEYKDRNKGNSFIDKRFGENNENLDEDTKAVMRFKRERQLRLKKQSKFALQNENEDVLTHQGMALSALDDFEDAVPDDEDMDLEDIQMPSSGLPHNEHQPGADPSGRKTKKEVMEELIAKSKHYKAMKAQEKEEDLELMQKLDRELKELVQKPELMSLVEPKRMKSLYAKLGTSSEKNTAEQRPAPRTRPEKEAPDDYDKLMSEISQEIRARPSDRRKTDAETAKEEKERLEELERKRKKRMLGEETESEGEEDENERPTKKRKTRTQASGDDLGENFEMEPLEMDEPADEEPGDEDEEAGDDDEDGFSEGDDSEEGDSEDEELNEEDEDGLWESSDEDEMVSAAAKPRTHLAEAVIPQQQQELPFVIDAPQTLEVMRQLVAGRPVQELELAIQRIRKCNAISLSDGNRKKMQVFYNVVLLYFSELAADKDLSIEKINVVTKALIEMSSETPYFAAVCARERLVRMQEQLTEKIRRGEGGVPSVRVLLLVRLWTLIFPGSDFKHVVTTPLMLLMGEYLMRCTISSYRDVAISSFLCTLVLSVMKQAKRFCPEALNFLLAILSSGLGDNSIGRSNCPQFLRKLIANQPWLRIKDDHSGLEKPEPLDFVETMTAEDDSELNSDTFRIGILNTSLLTLKGFVTIYDDLVSFPEVFSPFLPALVEYSMLKLLPSSLREAFGDLLEVITKRVAEHEKSRQPLAMRLKKPTPIRQFNPKFEESYVKGRDYDIVKERAEKKKLVRQLKKETKAAARELRKDNQFLAAEKAKEMGEAAEEREEKYRKAKAFLEQQEAESKSGLLGKRSRKRR